jgi:hypothetical protein
MIDPDEVARAIQRELVMIRELILLPSTAEDAALETEAPASFPIVRIPPAVAERMVRVEMNDIRYHEMMHQLGIRQYAYTNLSRPFRFCAVDVYWMPRTIEIPLPGWRVVNPFRQARIG